MARVICITVHTFHNETSSCFVAGIIDVSRMPTIFFELQTSHGTAWHVRPADFLNTSLACGWFIFDLFLYLAPNFSG